MARTAHAGPAKDCSVLSGGAVSDTFREDQAAFELDAPHEQGCGEAARTNTPS